MMTFIVAINFTDQGSRTIKDAPKRVQGARELAKKFGINIKNIYLTSGDSDLVTIIEAPDGDSVAKMALALGATGNVHTKTCRAWSEAEYFKIVSELP